MHGFTGVELFFAAHLGGFKPQMCLMTSTPFSHFGNASTPCLQLVYKRPTQKIYSIPDTYLLY